MNRIKLFSPRPGMRSSAPLRRTGVVLLLLGCCMLLSVTAAGAAPQAASPGPSSPSGLWQAGVLCGAGCARAAHRAALLSRWQSLLAGAAAAPVVTSAPAAPGGGPTFFILARHLKPLEANFEWAAAFCAVRGGELASWRNQGEYARLAALALSLAKSKGAVFHAYVGAAQTPGAAEPAGGWVWAAGGAPVGVGFPWARGEPNSHNGGGQKGHSEDCAVVATYHGAAQAAALVDDFPCNYGTADGKFQSGGYDPKLTVACRLGS
jgi:hypothetical protein